MAQFLPTAFFSALFAELEFFFRSSVTHRFFFLPQMGQIFTSGRALKHDVRQEKFKNQTKGF